MKLRIGTRGSDLALWQARTVKGWLEAAGAEIELVILETRGDKIDDVPLTQVEGKAFFTAEIERALSNRDVDVAVHSHKDLATENPPGLVVAAVPARGPVSERLLMLPAAFDEEAPFLPIALGARVGTSAPRRAEQLTVLRPDLVIESLRGNVPTRVRKLRDGQHDAIVLAAAGLERLGLDLDGLVARTLAPELFVPAPAQGALAIQVRREDTDVLELLQRCAHDEATARVIHAERRVLVAAGGGCSLPLGVLVEGSGPYIARAFLGADHPRAGVPARWTRAAGDSPEEAVETILAELERGRHGAAGPLAGCRIALAGSGEPGRLEERLTTLGAQVVRERVIELEDVPAADLAGELTRLRPRDVLALTSRRAAARLADVSVPEHVFVAAVGPSTAAALARVGITVDLVGSGGAGELARELPLEAGTRVLFPHAEEPLPDLPNAVLQRGAECVGVVVYRTRAVPGADADASVDARVYMSPSAVGALLTWERRTGPSPCARVALGNATWEALSAARLDAVPTDGSGPEAAVRALAIRLAPLRPSPEGVSQ